MGRLWTNITWLLEGHWVYLIQERNDEVLRRLHSEQKRLRFDRKYPNHQQMKKELDKITLWLYRKLT